MIVDLKKILLINSLIFFCGGVQAIDPRTFNFGPFEVAPLVSLNASHNDNLFKTLDNRVSSTSIVTAPSLTATALSGGNVYSLNARIEDGQFQDSRDDDYTDWSVGGSAQIQVNYRNSISVSSSLTSTRENRGTGFSEGLELPDEPAKYKIQDYGLDYQFGGDSSRGRLSLALSYNEIEYSELEADTFARNRGALGANTTLSIRISPDTSILIQHQYLEIDYVLDSIELLGSQDSKENYAYLGWEWQADSTISGSVLVGFGQKKYVSPLREDQDIPSWRAELRWEPLSYSSFTFNANSSFAEASSFGDGVESEVFGVNWQHGWSDRLSSNFSVQRQNSSFGGLARDDVIDSPSVQMSYAFRRWLDLSLGMSREVRDSTVTSLNLSQRVYTLGIQASL